MEKFAVDLDKVLDEFEFNEEKEQLQASIPNGLSSVGSNAQITASVSRNVLPAANYRRPAFEPINIADANFGIDPTTSTISDANRLSNLVVPDPATFLLDSHLNTSVEITGSELHVHDPLILDSNILPENNAIQDTLKEFRPDLLESYDSAKESDKNYSFIDNDHRLPDIASCPVLITSPDSTKDDSTISSELQSLNTSEVCEIDSTNAECSDVELYKCLEEYEDQENVLSVNNNCCSSNDVITPNSEFTDEFIAEKPLIGDDSVSGTKDSTSSNSSNDLPSTNDEIQDYIEESSIPICHDNDTIEENCTVSYHYDTTTKKADDILNTESGVKEALENPIEYKVEEKSSHKLVKDIPELPIVPDTNLEVESEYEELFNETNQLITDVTAKTDLNEDNLNEAVKKDYVFLVETQVEDYDDTLEKEHTDSLCSLESTETLLLKDDNQVSVATITDSLDSQSTCSLPSEIIGDNLEPRSIEDSHIQRPSTLNLNGTATNESEMPSTLSTDSDCVLSLSERQLGKIQPYWIPDEAAKSCMRCDIKFTVVKRRHHCRACGEVLCSKCCNLRARLSYMNNEGRVCQQCFSTLEKVSLVKQKSATIKHPNPNNPMEYCSTVPPLQQVGVSRNQPVPSVLVPVSVLKREGRVKSDVPKQVMFSDGIRPGGDLTDLDGSSERILPVRRQSRSLKKLSPTVNHVVIPANRRPLNSLTQSYIPNIGLPPAAIRNQGELRFDDTERPIAVNDPETMFAINPNLFLYVRRVFLDCCVKREIWCMSTEGLACVGQDEVVVLLETIPNEKHPPRDLFLFINHLYKNASIGVTMTDMSFCAPTNPTLLDSNNHGGFLFVRQTYQCMQKLRLPSPPHLFALLVHQYETPWAKMFPIRLMLRLGAEYRYYPCMLVSIRNRPSLYTEIGQTVIKLLVDFRQYSYGLPTVKGCRIHMDEKQIMVLLPRNRYDQVSRLVLSSNRGLLAFGANFSAVADSHLVCVQSTKDDGNYNTQAINIHNKPRQITGASFIALNGDLEDDAGTRWRIVEDGVMVEMSTQKMILLRDALRTMKDFKLNCGTNDEQTVIFHWTENDTNFNIGVKSCIDGTSLQGVLSIRVHNGVDYSGKSRFIRWTEVFVIQSEETSDRVAEPLDTSRTAESIAKATCTALVPLLDLLAAASLTPLALRIIINPDSVGYEAGSGQNKLPPLYMQSLDEHLVPVVNAIANKAQQASVVLELLFRVMEH
ncbi:zinc finger FYVE domain-containing protein 9 [Adelges cooleyi]|uniref:zinc finger FYVE domain-containing protein 9 n=1 Tax=Adelges cooleyi TaxID=133065 RepID=UPI0021802A7C|nr:zinc finger FYVE domain-containing protein 9 [Adelges cooleyi]